MSDNDTRYHPQHGSIIGTIEDRTATLRLVNEAYDEAAKNGRPVKAFVFILVTEDLETDKWVNHGGMGGEKQLLLDPFMQGLMGAGVHKDEDQTEPNLIEHQE